MSKKVLIGVMIGISAVCVAISAKVVHDSGVLTPYPEPKYLSEEESAVRPFYNTLTNSEKSVYEALYRGVSEKKTRIPFPYEINGDTYSKVYCMLEKQEGSFFYIDSVYYTAKHLREARIIMREDGNIGDKESELEKISSEILKKAPDGDDYDKALYIHDTIAELCEYVSGENREYSSTVYGCLAEKKANCEGYAKSFSYLAGKLGLVSVLVTGMTDKGESHAWNQVQIDGNWYNVDTTWDDMELSGEIRHLYFLCDDSMFSKTHFPENKYFQSFECSEIENNYYVRNGFFVSSDNDAEKVIKSELKKGKSKIELRFSDEQVYSDFKQKFITEQYIFRAVFESGVDGRDVAVTLRENESELCLTIYLEKGKNAQKIPESYF